MLPESSERAESGILLARLTSTDADGRYRLEDIEPGRYVIAAGFVSLPTYYPGTLNLADAKQFIVAPGSTVSGLDFKLLALSYSGVTIPIKLTVEGGVMPLSPAGALGRLRLLDEVSGRTVLETSLNVPSIAVTPEADLYLVVIDNLSAGYKVKSITYGQRDVRLSGLRLPAIDLTQASNVASGKSTSELAITLVAAPTTSR
jgi:hypothetical protein